MNSDRDILSQEENNATAVGKVDDLIFLTKNYKNKKIWFFFIEFSLACKISV